MRFVVLLYRCVLVMCRMLWCVCIGVRMVLCLRFVFIWYGWILMGVRCVWFWLRMLVSVWFMSVIWFIMLFIIWLLVCLICVCWLNSWMLSVVVILLFMCSFVGCSWWLICWVVKWVRWCCR